MNQNGFESDREEQQALERSCRRSCEEAEAREDAAREQYEVEYLRDESARLKIELAAAQMMRPMELKGNAATSFVLAAENSEMQGKIKKLEKELSVAQGKTDDLTHRLSEIYQIALKEHENSAIYDVIELAWNVMCAVPWEGRFAPKEESDGSVK
jgi:hypothetical protein